MSTSRTIGLVCVGLGLIVGGSAWIVHARHGSHATGPDTLSLMPGDSQFLASINVAAAKDSLIGNALKTVWDSGFFKRCDSFDHLATASVSFPARPAGQSEFVAVLTGDFDSQKIFSCIGDEMKKMNKPLVESTFGSHKIVQIEQIDLSQLDRHTFVIGSGRAFSDALDLADHKAGVHDVRGNAEMARLLAGTDRDATIWWTGAITQGLRDQLGGTAGVDSAVSHVTDTHGSLGLRAGLDANIVFGAASDGDAKQLVLMANHFIEAAGADPQMLRNRLVSYIQKIQARSDGKQLVLAVKLDAYEVKGLIAKVRRLGAPAARPPVQSNQSSVN